MKLPYHHLLKHRLSYEANNYVASTRLSLKLRDNDSELKNISSKGQYLLYHRKGLRPLMKNNDLYWLNFPRISDIYGNEPIRSVLLSVSNEDVPSYAVCTELNSINDYIDDKDVFFGDMTSSMFLLKDPDAVSLLTRGWSLLKWHQKFKFCQECGSDRLTRTLSGTSITCASCSRKYFPITSPVGIVLISKLDDSKALLVNLHRHPPNVFSCIAGFVDPGESLEECIRREVAEEVGLRVTTMEYLQSQHWPFPFGSLMLGFTAKVVDDSPDPYPVEVKEAKWFEPEVLGKALRNECSDLLLPPKGAIARTLIKTWMTKYHASLL